MLHTKRALLTIAYASLLCSCSSVTSSDNKSEAINTKKAKINSQLGIAYLEQQNKVRAKSKLLLALKQDPTIPEPWYSMGYFLETIGDNQQANKYYQKALEVSHGRGDAENNYGTFLCREGKYQESVHHFIKAANDPNYLAPADAYENAGLCASRIDGDNHASEYFNRALSYDSERPASWLALAEINFKHGNYKVAENDLKQFLQVSPPTNQSSTLHAKLSAKTKILA